MSKSHDGTTTTIGIPMSGKFVELREISKAQQWLLAQALSVFKHTDVDRNETMSQAYITGACTMAEIDEHFIVHY